MSKISLDSLNYSPKQIREIGRLVTYAKIQHAKLRENSDFTNITFFLIFPGSLTSMLIAAISNEPGTFVFMPLGVIGLGITIWRYSVLKNLRANLATANETLSRNYGLRFSENEDGATSTTGFLHHIESNSYIEV